MHDDYRKIPSFAPNFGRLSLAILNNLIKLECFLRCRTPAPGTLREEVTFTGFDGYSLKALVIATINRPTAAPVLVYFHGGGFAITYSSLHVRICERYALDADCVVVMVDYRLMPKYPFPFGFNDCFRTLQWVTENATTLGIDLQRIVVGGDSAGGTLAAGVAQKAIDQNIPLRGQMLVYPALDSNCDTQSATEFTDLPIWNSISNRRMWSGYLANFDGLTLEYAVPGHRKTLAGLPPAHIDTAEFDPLRDEGIAYAHALKAQGVPVELNETHGTIHGYEFAKENPETVKSFEVRSRFLRECFE